MTGRAAEDPFTPGARPSDAVLERLLSLHPKRMDLSLGRMHGLLARLGHPERRLPPVIHVAGTNGKGSTIAFLRAMAEAAGLRAHVYTSPHLARFAERIRVAGALLPEEALRGLLEECERLNGGAAVTFFEITTAAALRAFAMAEADVTLLETGLGGRQDATNVVDAPALTVITPVSRDHTAWLGERLGQIATEKAAIQKAGAPSIIGPQRPAAMAPIARRARAVGAPLFRHGREWHAHPGPDGRFSVTMGEESIALPAPALPGRHQVDNAATAVAAAMALRRTRPELALPDAALRGGVRNAVWPARLQHLRTGRLADCVARGGDGRALWLDGAHNPAGAVALAAHMAEWDDRPIDLVLGMLGTKETGAFLRALAPRARVARAVAVAGTEASLPVEEMAARARAAGLDCAPAADLVAALSSLPQGPARVVICGSLHLAGVALRLNGTDEDA